MRDEYDFSDSKPNPYAKQLKKQNQAMEPADRLTARVDQAVQEKGITEDDLDRWLNDEDPNQSQNR